MTEATWGGSASTPDIDWRMSAALENVQRGDLDVAEVTNLEAAVQAWLELEAERQAAAILRPERAVQVDGALHETLRGEMIAALAYMLGEPPPRS